MLAGVLFGACRTTPDDSGAQSQTPGSTQSSTQGSTGAGAPPSNATPGTTAGAAPVAAAGETPNPTLKKLFSYPNEWGDRRRWEGDLQSQNAVLLRQIDAVYRLSPEQRSKLEGLLAASKWMGQGNPAPTEHPMSVNECQARWAKDTAVAEQWLTNPKYEAQCGQPFMLPMFDPSKERSEQSRSCIDAFEFPNLPCVYPVTWARAVDAARLCEAVGKRLCDAHEWEGACDGKLLAPDYNFKRLAMFDTETALHEQRRAQNVLNSQFKTWSYGASSYQKGTCAAASKKSSTCNPISWQGCGSNTYPAGAFPSCRSPLGVFDLHGNAAEHMNLPLKAEEMASHPSRSYGHTEMKGSWFIFDNYYAHEDYCRWRAPYWHGTKVMSELSHHNYHLGFRCCKDVE